MNSVGFAELVAVHGLPVPWLATHVAGVSERTFRYWVSGRPGMQVAVPADAVARLQRLNAAISAALI
jgi:hypothetical protein